MIHMFKNVALAAGIYLISRHYEFLAFPTPRNSTDLLRHATHFFRIILTFATPRFVCNTPVSNS